MSDLVGQVWLVTGAAAGLGRAIVEEALARGATVVAGVRRADAPAFFGGHEDNLWVVQLDVTSAAEIAAAVGGAEARYGKIDVLVNSAGYGLLAAVEEASEAEVRAQFDVNVFGLAAMIRAVLPGMRERGQGAIINLSSTVGVRAGPGMGYYSASKFAVEGLSEALSKETAELGLRVMIVELGPFRTDFSGRSIGEPANPIAAYTAAAATRSMSAGLHGKQRGDPKRAARLLIDAIGNPEKPLRIALGESAFLGALDALQGRLSELEWSREIAVAADFEAETAD